MKLTASTISRLTLPPDLDDKIYFDDDLPGFGLRLRRSGDRSWWVQYAIAGRTRKLRLGSVAELDISKARSTAKNVLAQVRLGGDPASEKAHARVRAGETFGALLKPFMLRQQTRLKPRSLDGDASATWSSCAGRCTRCRSRRSTRRTIAARLAAIAQTNGPAAANRVRGSLGAFCTWARRGRLPRRQPGGLHQQGDRERTARPAAVGCRAGADLAGARRRSVRRDREAVDPDRLAARRDRRAALVRDRPGRQPHHPAGRAHQERPPASGADVGAGPGADRGAAADETGRDRVFGDAARGVLDWNDAKVALDQRLAEINGEPLAPWVVHDLRRAFSTALHDKFGVPPHIVEVVARPCRPPERRRRGLQQVGLSRRMRARAEPVGRSHHGARDRRDGDGVSAQRLTQCLRIADRRDAQTSRRS